MRLDRQIVWLMAVIFITALACGLPSAVQAHPGHDHGPTRQATSSAVLISAADSGKSAMPAAPARSALLAVEGTGEGRDAAPGFAFEAAMSDLVDADGGESPSACDGFCCGLLTCCVAGIVPNSLLLPGRPSHRTTLAAMNVLAPLGIRPEAMRKPPRTLA